MQPRAGFLFAHKQDREEKIDTQGPPAVINNDTIENMNIGAMV